MLIKDFFKFFAKKPVEYVQFIDPMKNFQIFYPKNWHFDQDIVVYNWSYNICFESNHEKFIVSVDIKEDIDFEKYFNDEFNSPKSGVISTNAKLNFQGFPGFSREFSYSESGKTYIGKGIVFYTGRIIYSLTWMGPAADLAVFEAMKKSFTYRK